MEKLHPYISVKNMVVIGIIINAESPNQAYIPQSSDIPQYGFVATARDALLKHPYPNFVINVKAFVTLSHLNDWTDFD